MLIILAHSRQSKMGGYLVNHERTEYELARKAAKYAADICMDWRRDTDGGKDLEGVNAFLRYVVSGTFIDATLTDHKSHMLPLESSDASGNSFVGRRKAS